MTTIIQRLEKFLSQDMDGLTVTRLVNRELRDNNLWNMREMPASYASDVRNFWSKYTPISPRFHHFCTSRNAIRDVRYIPPSVFFGIVEPSLNRKDFAGAIGDKSYYPELLAGAPQPYTVARGVSGTLYDAGLNAIELGEAVRLCSAHDEIVIKPSIGHSGGNRIQIVKTRELTSRGLAARLLEYRGNFVIQEVVEQHPVMRSFNPTSVNTLRLTTLLAGGRASLLSAVLRVGGPGSRVDNISSGGFFCGVSPDGITQAIGFDTAYRTVGRSAAGSLFGAIEIPSFGEAVQMVEELHPRFGHFHLISWDVSIGVDDRPLLIEFNLARQGVVFHQVANGPIFGDQTEQVLDGVFETASRKTVTRLIGWLEKLP